NEILMEYQGIIAERYGLTRTEATLDFLLLLPNVNAITPHYKWRLIEQDEDDNKFVGCAVASNADYIVGNNKHFRILKTIDFPKVKVLRAEEFAALYKDKIMNHK
ncbi:MAG: PIN domain-containing protein, partial [Bacteroidota bacterium]